MARRVNAFIIRVKASKFYKKMRLQSLTCNGDEKRYPNKIASFSKALPHNDLGEVDLDAYNDYIKALKSGNPDDFERIPL
ncbi:phosphoesterase, partial [Staphylococcus sp. SIMBA_130]